MHAFNCVVAPFFSFTVVQSSVVTDFSTCYDVVLEGGLLILQLLKWSISRRQKTVACRRLNNIYVVSHHLHEVSFVSCVPLFYFYDSLRRPILKDYIGLCTR